MNKKTVTALSLILLSFNLFAQWNPTTDKIRTKWAEEVTPDKVLPEYPRPLLERTQWNNLNGLWDYAILPTGSVEPTAFDGKILVPFAVESNLSGVQKQLGKDNELWYRRTFSVPSSWKNKSVILNFGAVDWKAEVYVNDVKIGEHTGGYTPFSFDITPYLIKGEQKLVVKVWDPSSDGSEQPRGKQVSKPGGIFYTSVSGIWQTVWLEPVSKKYIADIKTTADIDTRQLSVNVCVANASPGDIVEVLLKDGTATVASSKFAAGQQILLPVPNQKLWSPKSPFLYDLEINLYENGKLQDKVKSYAAMRKISTLRNRDDKIVRMQLNNEDLFQFGPLDQGWWPDGLYTAPTDEALAYDVQKTKDFGYNMIRKHVKVEPARWYTHCDRLGILVWQDMPSGGPNPRFQHAQYFNGVEAVRSAESENNFRKEWKEIIDLLKSNPCVVVWVPFNESWGQFKTPEITKWTKDYDPSRLVNPASGGNNYPDIGDILDVHNYPEPAIFLYDTKRANVIGEYGGIGLPIEGHLWQADKNWGYVKFKNSKEATDEYVKYAEMLKTLIPRGFCAGVYTQTTDVEGEVNGLMTYDRKVIKLEESRLKKVNEEICNSLSKQDAGN
ncbi:MAG: beta-galactosidase [Prevotellaceae bacterium]|jgi:beta-galactosidase/beta-glucuronidase|nr:beta-galactosidase [Prevotellaceae bacterium]